MAEYRVEVHGSVGGNLVVGDHNIVVNAQTGSSVRILQEAERPAPTRRPRVRVLPRRPAEPIGRSGELGTITAAVFAQSTLQVYGAPGVGKSTLLRAAAHDIADDTDGVVFVSVAGRHHGDVPQEIFEACYETHGYRPSPTDLARLMSGVRVTAFVDDLECTPDQLSAVLDAVPDTTVVFSATERELWGSGRAFELSGLTEAAALALAQRECGRALSRAESASVLAAWRAGGGSPMRVLRLAATLAAGSRATGVARVPAQAGPADEDRDAPIAGAGLGGPVAGPGRDAAGAGRDHGLAAAGEADAGADRDVSPGDVSAGAGRDAGVGDVGGADPGAAGIPGAAGSAGGVTPGPAGEDAVGRASVPGAAAPDDDRRLILDDLAETLSPRESDLYSLLRAVGRARVTTPVLAVLAEAADESRIVRAAARLAAVGLADEFDDEADGRSGGASPLAADEGGEAGLPGAGDPRAFQVADDIEVGAPGTWTYRRDIGEVAASMTAWVSAPGRAARDVAAHVPLIVSLVDASVAGGVPAAGCRLARASAAPVALSLRWGAWRDVLTAGQSAARAADDRESVAYFTHERGIRLLALGQAAAAAGVLATAAGLWQALGLGHSAALATQAHGLASVAAGIVPTLPPPGGAGHAGGAAHGEGAAHGGNAGQGGGPGQGGSGPGQGGAGHGGGAGQGGPGHGGGAGHQAAPPHLAPPSPPPPVPKPFPILPVTLSVIVALVIAGGAVAWFATRPAASKHAANPTPSVTASASPSESVPPPVPIAFADASDPAHLPPLVLDGDPATVWATPAYQEAKSPDAWIGIDLGVTRTCTGLTVTPLRGLAFYPLAYRIQTSDDRTTWIDVPGQVYGLDRSTEPRDGAFVYTFDAPVAARYVRLVADVMRGTKPSDTAVTVPVFRMVVAEMSVQTSP